MTAFKQFVIFGTQYRTSRKDRKCWLCGGDLPKGSKYWRIAGLNDGNPFSVASCRERCETLPETLDQNPLLRSQLDRPVYEAAP